MQEQIYNSRIIIYISLQKKISLIFRKDIINEIHEFVFNLGFDMLSNNLNK